MTVWQDIKDATSYAWGHKIQTAGILLIGYGAGRGIEAVGRWIYPDKAKEPTPILSEFDEFDIPFDKVLRPTEVRWRKGRDGDNTGYVPSQSLILIKAFVDTNGNGTKDSNDPSERNVKFGVMEDRQIEDAVVQVAKNYGDACTDHNKFGIVVERPTSGPAPAANANNGYISGTGGMHIFPEDQATIVEFGDLQPAKSVISVIQPVINRTVIPSNTFPSYRSRDANTPADSNAAGQLVPISSPNDVNSQ